MENNNLLNKGGEEMSAAALKSLHHLQMLKVFSNMTEATRQAYLQTQALQKKPYYMSPPPPPAPGGFSKEQGSFNKDPIRPYPLSTPDIKTPRVSPLVGHMCVSLCLSVCDCICDCVCDYM